MKKKLFAVLSAMMFLTVGAFAIISLQSNKVRADEASAGQYYAFVTTDHYFVSPGGKVRFFGSHFLPRERVVVETDGVNIRTIRADYRGNFRTQPFTVPYMNGSKIYNFTGVSSGLTFPIRIDVGPSNAWMVLSTYYAGAGSPITITGHQFGSNENVSVYFNGIYMGMIMTTENGDFTFNTTVPRGIVGRHTVTVTGLSTGLSASQGFSQAF